MKSDLTAMVYLDHQIWSGVAYGEERYSQLRPLVTALATLPNVVLPYSAHHIQELAEIGRRSGLSTSERRSRVDPILQFMKEVSNSRVIEANTDYSRFRLIKRDPFEFYDTFTELKLSAARTDMYINLVPEQMVKEIRLGFDLSPQILNTMTESEAIERVNLGIQNFTERCKTNPEYREFAKKLWRESSIRLIENLRDQTLVGLAEAFDLMESQKANIRDVSILGVIDAKLDQLRNEKVKLETNYQNQIDEIENSNEGLGDPDAPMTFDQILAITSDLYSKQKFPPGFHRAYLLDFFGYKSKLKNRSSDYFDLLHRQFVPAVDYFVTDDSKFAQKLLQSSELSPGSKQKILGLEEFQKLIRKYVS